MKKKVKKGFTLAELLVVMFIISLFSGFSFFFAREADRELTINRAIFKLAQDIRRTQEMAMAEMECCDGRSPTGYMISFQTGATSYTISAKLQNGQTIIMETIKLEKNTRVDKISTSSSPSGPTYNNVTITFIPPDPTVLIQTDHTTSSEVYIFISLFHDPTRERKVLINKAGLIAIF